MAIPSKWVSRSLTSFQKLILHNAFCLRYFNPVGAHPTASIGELPIGKPANLVPAITQTAMGKLPQMTVYGDDYPTRDGSCIRDYIHVCDIAHAHTLGLLYLLDEKTSNRCEVFNLGSGNGVTVLEAIKSFEKVSGVKLNYTIGTSSSRAMLWLFMPITNTVKDTLGWEIKYSLDEMMLTAWKWEQRLKKKSIYIAFKTPA
jgi:UDP-glucose 4-epimerase